MFTNSEPFKFPSFSEIKKPYKHPIMKKTMVEDTIGGRPVDIIKDGDKVKIVFHPAAKNAKHPKAALFTITLSNADLTKIKKSL